MYLRGDKMNKNYLVTIYNKGIFGSTTTMNITNVGKDDKFYKYENNCFILWGQKNGKSIYFSFPLDKVEAVNIEEC